MTVIAQLLKFTNHSTFQNFNKETSLESFYQFYQSSIPISLIIQLITKGNECPDSVLYVSIIFIKPFKYMIPPLKPRKYSHIIFIKKNIEEVSRQFMKETIPKMIVRLKIKFLKKKCSTK